MKITIEFSDGTVMTTESSSLFTGLNDATNLLLERHKLAPSNPEATWGRPIKVVIEEK